MNEQQLTQVMNGVDEATAYAPGESKQLVPAPTPEQRAVQTRNNIIADATQLAADMKAVYRERVEEAQRKYEAISKIADLIVENAIGHAEEVDRLATRDRKIGAGFARVLEEAGITFEGEI